MGQKYYKIIGEPVEKMLNIPLNLVKRAQFFRVSSGNLPLRREERLTLGMSPADP